MCTCGSMKPGKTYLPCASTTSSALILSMLRSIRVIVSFSQKMSATYFSFGVTISPFLIRSDKGPVTSDQLNAFGKFATQGVEHAAHFIVWFVHRQSIFLRTKLQCDCENYLRVEFCRGTFRVRDKLNELRRCPAGLPLRDV